MLWCCGACGWLDGVGWCRMIRGPTPDPPWTIGRWQKQAQVIELDTLKCDSVFANLKKIFDKLTYLQGLL